MNKCIKTALCSILALIAVLLIVLAALLCVGFRFAPEATVNTVYRDNFHIHADEYDFYMDEVTDSESGEVCYATGHEAVKKYGLLYKRIKSADKTVQALVTEKGESVGKLVTYAGEEKTHCFIHWTMTLGGSIVPYETGEGSVSAYTTMKYASDKIILNGKEQELYLYCYFVTDEPVGHLLIKDENVFILNSRDEGKYWRDESVMVISTELDIDPEKIKSHYDNGGIIVVRETSLSNDVQIIIKGLELPESDEKDLAALFCKTKDGVSYTGVIQGNTTDLESEIDSMVARAKSEQ